MKSQALKYLPVNFANILVSFGTITILTRLLTAEEFGRYALVITTTFFLHMALFSWLEAAMARFQERANVNNSVPAHNRTLYFTAIVLGLSSVTLIISILYLLPLDDWFRLLLIIATANTALYLIYGLTIESHKAAQRIGRYSFIHSTQLVLSFSLGVLLIMVTPLKEAGPFIGLMIGGIVAIAVELPGIISRSRGGSYDKVMIKEYFFYGSPISFTLVLAYALANGDLFFIKYFMGDQFVGTYSAGYNFANSSLHYLFLWLSMAIMPIAITTLERKGKDYANQILSDYGETLVILTLPAALGIALVSNEAGFILGESVRDQAVLIMPWIAFAALLNGFINLYVHQAYVLAKKLNVLAAIMVIPVFVNFGLNFLFIPKFGLYGAVISTVSAYSLGLILSIIGAKKVFTLPLPIKTIVQCIIACCIMAFCVTQMPLNVEWPDFAKLLTKAAVGAIVYTTSIFILNPSNFRSRLKLLSTDD